MIPANVDSHLETSVRPKTVESLIDWFDQHKQEFYILGGFYLPNQQLLEELFYRCIVKIHKGLPRFKNETSFENWITSIFIHTCRELSIDKSLQASEGSEPPQLELLTSIHSLNQDEREAILLAYVKGYSHLEVAQLLQISVDKVKELLFTGIRSLRKELENSSTYNGCIEYHKHYIDYLERDMDRSKKIEFEVHIYHCQNCQEDLATFRDVMFTMVNLTEGMEDFQVPSEFMENVKARLAEDDKRKQQKNKKRKKIGLVFGTVLAFIMGIGFFTGAFSKLYYTWTEDDQEFLALLQQGLSERVNLEAESNGVVIRIKGAVADDVQTLVYYEIEDTDEDNQYFMDYHNGVSVENEYVIMNRETYPRYSPPNLESEVNKEGKNVYQGKMSLLPISEESGTIKLKITRVQKLVREMVEQNEFGPYGNSEFETGEWNFEIPVTKQPSIEYALNKEIEVEGIPIRLDKLTIAPTGTILHYGFKSNQQKKRIDALNIGHLEVNNKKVKSDMYGNSFSHQNTSWNMFQTHFGPLIGEKPKEIKVHLDSVHLTVDDPKTIILDSNQEYPQTFEYAGSTITIEKVEVGQPSNIVISDHEVKDRAYQSLHFNIVGDERDETSSMEMDIEGVLVDKSGKEYDMNNSSIAYNKLEQPRHFITVQKIRLHSQDAEVKLIPKRLEIYGYNTMKYLDHVVDISVE
jgi:RNA polymerase sigma factor (sigma-70 family)